MSSFPCPVSLGGEDQLLPKEPSFLNLLNYKVLFRPELRDQLMQTEWVRTPPFAVSAQMAQHLTLVRLLNVVLPWALEVSAKIESTWRVTRPILLQIHIKTLTMDGRGVAS